MRLPEMTLSKPSERIKDRISYQRIVFHARNAYGQLVDVMLEREGTAEGVINKLWRGDAKAFGTTRYLGINKAPSDEILP